VPICQRRRIRAAIVDFYVVLRSVTYCSLQVLFLSEEGTHLLVVALRHWLELVQVDQAERAKPPLFLHLRPLIRLHVPLDLLNFEFISCFEALQKLLLAPLLSLVIIIKLLVLLKLFFALVCSRGCLNYVLLKPFKFLQLFLFLLQNFLEVGRVFQHLLVDRVFEFYSVLQSSCYDFDSLLVPVSVLLYPH